MLVEMILLCMVWWKSNKAKRGNEEDPNISKNNKDIKGLINYMWKSPLEMRLDKGMEEWNILVSKKF